MRVATMTPLEVEELFQQRPADGADLDSPETVAQRSHQLQKVLETAQHLWFAGDTEIDAVAEKLGDGSRDASWRLPLGESGILSFFLSLVAIPDVRVALKRHTLRLIGNSCADTDANRARVVQSGRIPSIASLIPSSGDGMAGTGVPNGQGGQLMAYVVPVLYNICVDYEPAQEAAFHAGLARQLGDAMTAAVAGSGMRGVMGLAAQILTFWAGKEYAVGREDLLSSGLPIRLLTIPPGSLAGGLEEYVTVVSAGLAFLSEEERQKWVIAAEPASMIPLLGTYDMVVSTWVPAEGEDDDVVAAHKSMKTAFLTVLSDMSGLDEFKPLAPNLPDMIHILTKSFLLSPNQDLQTLACLMLGNLSRDDETSVRFASPAFNIHVRAGEILADPENAPNTTLLHASLGLLKNLAIPAPNKPLLGPSLLGTPTAPLPQLWAVDTLPQVQFSSVSLTRSLCTGCTTNVKILLKPLSDDQFSPASQRSKLSVLLDLFSRADAEPTRVECARLVLAVCRVMHSTPIVGLFWPTLDEVESLQMRASKTSDRICKTVAPAPAKPPADMGPGEHWAALPPQPLPGGGFGPESMPTPPGAPPGSNGIEENPEVRPSARRAHFYACHGDVAKALAMLVGQDKWPALRSECWFVFALMARSAEGARVVMAALIDVESTSAVVEALTGKKVADAAEVGGLLEDDRSKLGAEGEYDEEEDIKMDMGESSVSPHNTPGSSATAGTPGASAISKTQREQEEQLRSLGLDGGLQAQQVDPRKKQNMDRVDRENAVVMVTELLRNCPDMPPFRRRAFQMLLRRAGEIMQAPKQS